MQNLLGGYCIDRVAVFSKHLSKLNHKLSNGTLLRQQLLSLIGCLGVCNAESQQFSKCLKRLKSLKISLIRN
jgi:hypothetical protein